MCQQIKTHFLTSGGINSLLPSAGRTLSILFVSALLNKLYPFQSYGILTAYRPYRGHEKKEGNITSVKVK